MPGSGRSTPPSGTGAARKWGAAPTIASRASTPPRSSGGWYWTKALATLDTIPFDQLSAEEQVNAQIFRTSLRGLVSDIQYKTYEAPFNSDTFFWTGFTPREGFANAAAYKSYLARLRDVPRYFDEQMVNMRAGLARGYTVPRVSVLGRDKTIEPYLKGDATNPLFVPFTDFPANMPAAEQAALREEAMTVMRDSIVPAFSKLMALMREEYLPKATARIGASTLPEGNAFYQAQIERHTTLTLTPKEIHEIGLKEVARIEAEMRATKDRAKFTGTMAEFFRFMQTIRSSTRRRRRSCWRSRPTSRRRPTTSWPRPLACCLAGGTASAPSPTTSRPSTPAAAAGWTRAR